MSAEASQLQAVFASLVNDYRARCLWFLHPDYTPTTPEAQLRILDYIQRYGDVAAFHRVATLRQWLSRPSNEVSAG
jgi:hypothetical protein